MKKLDETDQKILSELKKNCRKPIAEIARTARINRETCRYRIERLEKSIISHYVTLVNEPAWGKQREVYYTDSPLREENNPHILWTGQIIGNHQYVSDFLHSGDPERPRLETDYQVLRVKQRIINNIKTYTEADPKLSVEERRVLNLLQESPRMSYVDIAKEIDASASTALRIVRRLEERDIVQGFSLHQDPFAIDASWANIRVKYFGTSKVSTSIADHENILYVYEYEENGKVDLDIGCMFHVPSEFHQIVERIKTILGENGHITGTNLVLKEISSDT